METLLAFAITSGALGLVANYFVSAGKALYKRVHDVRVVSFDPRVLNAVVSLLIAFLTLLAGGDVDPASVTSWLELLATTGVTWLVAHLTHKTNSV